VTRVRRATAAETDTVRRLLTAALLEPPPSLANTVAAEWVHVALGGASDDTRGAEPAVRNADATPRLVGCLVRLPPAETPDAGHVAATVETLPPERRPFDPAAWRDRTTATHVDSVAVARGRRGDGVGTALVESAVDAAAAAPPGDATDAAASGDATDAAASGDASDPSTDSSPLTVAFRPAVRPFYESLGFTVVPPPDGERLVGWWGGDG
jgi:GNAT superfamily N-acetyltransferase